MGDGNDAQQSAGGEPRSTDRARTVAAVSSPDLSAARLTLPGVMDADGRVDKSRLDMHIFKNGGVCPSERGLAWRFLFGMYSSSSTALERSLVQEQLFVRYQIMKTKWQRFLPSTVQMHLNFTDTEMVRAVQYFDQRETRAHQQTQDQSEEVRDRRAFLQLQAQILVERVVFKRELLKEAIRIIDKDVPRTNRDLSYYQNKGLGNLLVLRNILITYAAFHPEVSYSQGMNDLCSRFLEVLDCEVDAFWSFSCYMEKFSKVFMVDGVPQKIELEAALLKELDPPLYSHLTKDGIERFAFCHRWLLLGFQREFEQSEALRLFEILSCDHLDLISQQVDRARLLERLAGRYSTDDSSKSELPTFNTDFTFELFICAAILLENRESLLECKDDFHFFQFMNSIQGKLDLNSTLKKAEQHFYNYCKRCAGAYMIGRCWSHRPAQEDFFSQFRSLFVLK